MYLPTLSAPQLRMLLLCYVPPTSAAHAIFPRSQCCMMLLIVTSPTMGEQGGSEKCVPWVSVNLLQWQLSHYKKKVHSPNLTTPFVAEDVRGVSD